MKKHIAKGLALVSSLGTLGYLAVATIIAALSPHQAVAQSDYPGDQFTNGRGQFVCVCGGTNCKPCATVT